MSSRWGRLPMLGLATLVGWRTLHSSSASSPPRPSSTDLTSVDQLNQYTRPLDSLEVTESMKESLWQWRWLIPSALTVSAATPFSSGSSSRRRQFNFVAEVVRLCAPAVVYIEVGTHGHHMGMGQTSNGSGFIIQEDGLLLTNAHVVLAARNSQLKVRLHDGRVFNGKIESLDVKSDLAKIRIPAKGLPTMKLGISSDIEPGEWVVAMGSPLSLNNTVTAGVVSSTSRGSDELGMFGKDMSYIQTDAAITFGNSGGPLVNLDGEVIGINSMKVTSGISFAIPIDYVKDFLAKGSGRSTPGKKYIGITMLSLTPDIIKMIRQQNVNMSSSVIHGVLVWKVVVGSPADESGIQPGDIITDINGSTVNSANDVYKLLEGDITNVAVKIVRNGRIFVINVIPDETFN